MGSVGSANAKDSPDTETNIWRPDEVDYRKQWLSPVVKLHTRHPSKLKVTTIEDDMAMFSILAVSSNRNDPFCPDLRSSDLTRLGCFPATQAMTTSAYAACLGAKAYVKQSHSWLA